MRCFAVEEKYSRKSQILSAPLSFLKFKSVCSGSGENKICNFMNQPFIPVIHSIFEGAALIDTVLSEYLINKPHSCKLYKRGLNDTYLIEAEQQRYILRIYRCSWRNKEEIGFELELLAFLHKQNQPVAYPIIRKDGDFTTEISAPEGVGITIPKNVFCTLRLKPRLGKVFKTCFLSSNW